MADISVIIDVIGIEDMVGATKAADRMRKEYKHLDRQFNQGKINAQQYSRGIRQVDARIDALTMAQRQAASSSVAMHKNMANGGRIMNQYSGNINVATQKTKRFGAVGMQQVGYQVQDFAVQVQSGTSAMVALGQQGSQLLGIFGPAGAIGGMILAIGTGLAGAFMASRNAAEDATGAFEEADKALEQFNSIAGRLDGNLNTLAASLTEAREEFGEFADEVKEAAEFAARQDINNLVGSINNLEVPNDALGDFKETLDDINRVINSTQVSGGPTGGGMFVTDEAQKATLEALYKDLSDLEEQYGLTTAQAVTLRGALDFGEVDSLSGAAEQAGEALSVLQGLEDASGNIPDSLDPLVPVLTEIQQRTAAFVTTVEEGEEAAERTGEAMRSIQEQANAAGAAYMERLATEEQINRELQNQIDLHYLELQFGKDSANYAREKAEQERQAYIEGLRSDGLNETQVQRLMQQYDALQNINEAISYQAKLTAGAAAQWNAVSGFINQAEQGVVGLTQRFLESAGAAGRIVAVLKTIGSQLQSLGQGLQDLRGLGSGMQGIFTGGGKVVELLGNFMGSDKVGSVAAGLVSAGQDMYNQAIAGGSGGGGGSTGGGAAQAAQEVQKLNDALSETQVLMQDVGKTISQSFGDALMSIVDGSKSAADAFKDMARQILKQAFDMLVVKPIMNSIMGFFGGNQISGPGFGLGNRANFAPPVRPFADGGVVSGAQMFSHSGGLGVMGEAGPEAIMPLKRGKNGKLGVQVEGGSGNVTVENHFHISANGDDSVKRIIQQEAPKIASYTQQQILDQRRRGGAMKQTFG